jgi:hypothetical protein
MVSLDLGIDGSQMFAGPQPLWGRSAIDLQALVAPLLCSRAASTAVQARKKVEAKLANIIMAGSSTRNGVGSQAARRYILGVVPLKNSRGRPGGVAVDCCWACPCPACARRLRAAAA